MRLRKISLIKYGRFNDCTLSFEPEACDLHLVIGPNEAGKSTTLSAVSDLLFSFEHRTRYDFRFNKQELRVGAIIEDGDKSLEVRRKRGNTHTLLRPDETAFSEAELSAILAGQTRESFTRMFGLNQVGLREGGKAILDASDDVGQAIFAAGSGLVHISRVCDDLEEEVKAIWSTRGAVANRRYSAAAQEFAEAKAKLRDVEVRAPEWSRARRSFVEAEQELDRLRSDRAELRQQHATVERKRRVLVSSSRRNLLQTQLDALGTVPTLTETSATALDNALSARDLAKADRDRAQAAISALQTDIDDARPDPDALDLHVEVEALRDLKTGVENARANRPALDARLKVARERLAASIGELGWADQDSAGLKSTIPGRPAVAEVRALLERRSVIDQQLHGTGETLAEAGAALARARQQVEAAPVPSETKSLQSLARDIRDRGVAEAVNRTALQTAELDALLAHGLDELHSWNGGLDELRAVNFPADEDIEAALGRISTARSAKETSREHWTRAREGLEQSELQHRQSLRAHPLPTIEILTAARSEREAAWTPLKNQLAGGTAVTSVESAITAFEQNVAAADHLADERFAGAEHAGGLSELEKEIERKRLAHDQAEARYGIDQSELAGSLAAFDQMLQGCGVSLSPEAFLGWRQSAFEILETARARDDAARDAEAAIHAETQARQGLLDALGDRPDASGQSSMVQLLALADQDIELATQYAARAAVADSALTAAEEALDRARLKESAAKAAETVWDVSWALALTAARLPKDGSPASARIRLELIETVRSETNEISTLEATICANDAEISAFDQRVADAGERLSDDGQGGLAALIARVEKAVRLSARAVDLDARLQTANAALEDADSRQVSADFTLTPLSEFSTAEAPDLSDLLRRARAAANLQTQIQEVDREIVMQGEGRSLTALLEEVAGGDPDELKAEAEALAVAIEDAQAAVDAQTATRAEADLHFKGHGDGPNAAIAAFEVAQAQSEMVEQAEAYIRKRAELYLLRAAIERYRKAKQAPLLDRASALFKTLTLGAFSRLIVDLDSGKPRLAGIRADDSTVTTDGMSEGTTDQLYLALRIAAVEDAVDNGVRMPFFADDLFVNFDDERAAAGFRVLAELARKTQVLFFTHHAHLADVASAALSPSRVHICRLERETPLPSLDAQPQPST